MNGEPPGGDPAGSAAARLRQLRSRHGLSQEQLARLLGVSFATVNRWETGRTQMSARARQALADFEARDGRAGGGQASQAPASRAPASQAPASRAPASPVPMSPGPPSPLAAPPAPASPAPSQPALPFGQSRAP